MKPYCLVYADLSKHFTQRIKGITIKTPAGYIVGIDSRLCAADQDHALRHELAHIVLAHLEDNRMDELRQVREKEAEAYADAMTEETLQQLRQYEEQVLYL